MYEIMLIDPVTNWYKRVATFGARTNAQTFIKKVGLNLMADYTELHPMVEIKIREIMDKIY